MPASPVRYRITPQNPRAHLFEVETVVDTPDPSGQRFTLPTWIPGSYLVREFARHIVDVKANVPVEKVAKNEWRAAPVASGPLVVTTTIYAWDLSVRAAHLDQTHAFFNGTSVFFSVAGKENAACDVVVEPPNDPLCKGWRVATTLPALDVRPPGFGTYRASSYDELIDHPVEMGTYELVEWNAGGVPHQMALTGRARFDRERLAKDLAAVCGEHIRMFHGSDAPPMKRYLFLTTALGEGYGGLEHRDSSSLICKRDDLPKPNQKEPSDGYRGFLGLCSHEYFHLWNVKRIKPAAFVPYKLDEEAYTRQLWAFEGITSYYDDLALVRAGVITVESWLELIGRTITRVHRGSGRKKQSVAESSFDAWIKFYRPDENTPNAVVSYYTKGSLVALGLDLTIRGATDEKRSLDDVMRALFERYGDANGAKGGVPEDGVERAASEIAGVDLRPFFDEYVRGTKDVPLAGLLAPYGIELAFRPAEGESDQGGKPGKKSRDELLQRGTVGVTLASGDDGAHLAHVHDGGAAQEAGLSAGDVVVAVDGLRASRGNFQKLIAERAPGAKVRMHAFRRDELLEVDVVLKAPDVDTAWLALRTDDDAATKRNAWLRRDTPMT